MRTWPTRYWAPETFAYNRASWQKSQPPPGAIPIRFAVGAVSLFGDIGTPARMTVEFAGFTTSYLLVWIAQPGGPTAARDGWSLLMELARGAGARLRGTGAPPEVSVTGD